MSPAEKLDYEQRMLLIALKAIDYLRTSKLELITDHETAISIPPCGEHPTGEVVPGEDEATRMERRYF
jgi:hypothetical protein